MGGARVTSILAAWLTVGALGVPRWRRGRPRLPGRGILLKGAVVTMDKRDRVPRDPPSERHAQSETAHRDRRGSSVARASSVSAAPLLLRQRSSELRAAL